MTLPSPSESVIVKELADGAVLYCSRTEVYFGLNDVGMAVWQSLPPVFMEMDDLIEDLARRFPEVPVETIRTDAVEFLTDLESNELVKPAGSAVAGD